MGRPLMSWRNRAHSPMPGRSLLDLTVYEADVLLMGRRRPDVRVLSGYMFLRILNTYHRRLVGSRRDRERVILTDLKRLRLPATSPPLAGHMTCQNQTGSCHQPLTDRLAAATSH
ncbi:hypothetical protein ROHU_012477 [Labeo rohita]|uniref:Uncharacterized protein n=1 Tax=Labeo rohita TaxID=84645 RepID=A0A498LG59_LABRO|nr:hypothetical protein ROHU_012477 [Labeo rohita]